jgi:hypothetical protein
MWPRREYEWIEGGVLHISVPFTWCLSRVQKRIASTWMKVKVGGPAVELMYDYLKGAEIGHESEGVLQRINPLATRTTVGCPSKCKFCAVPIIEGCFRELDTFPTGWVICDNNFLASSYSHIERVVEMLRTYGQADFNQGLDAALVTQDIADLIATIGKPIIRMALDSQGEKDVWERAYECWRRAKIPKNRIRSYVLIGFDSGPDEAWDRCKWVEAHGVKALPMWFHELYAMKKDEVTEKQIALGWSKKGQDHIMDFYYQHRGIAA